MVQSCSGDLVVQSCSGGIVVQSCSGGTWGTRHGACDAYAKILGVNGDDIPVLDKSNGSTHLRYEW